MKISIKKCHRLYRLALRSNGGNIMTRYKAYKNKLRICIQEAESLYYHQLFEDNTNSAYNLWKKLGPMINPRKRKGGTITKLFNNGQMVTDITAIPDIMNDFYCNIGPQLQQNMPPSTSNFKQYLPERVDSSFYLTPVLVEDVLSEIKSLNPRKATGHDNIAIKIIQLCPEIFAFNLSKVFCNTLVELDITKVPKICHSLVEIFLE